MMFLPLGSSSAWHTRSSQTQQSSDIHYHRLFKINAMKTRYGRVVVSEGAEKERNQPMVAAWFAVKGRSHFFQLGDEAPHQNQVDFVSCAKNWSVGLHIVVRFVMSHYLSPLLNV